MKRIVACAALVVVAGCFTRSAGESRFFRPSSTLLRETQDPSVDRAERGAPSVRLRGVDAAPFRRERIVWRTSDVEYGVYEQRRWVDTPSAYVDRALQEALRRSGCAFVIAPGDGAFYGPKIEYTLKDALGRPWQLGTMQVDFNTAERLGGDYVTETSGRAFPVMLHRAIVGSFERFIGILLEHHAGAMPAWLAPVQASVLNISEGSADYAESVAKTLRKQGLRVESDLRNEKITYKIREHSLQKVPYILVVGDKEKASGAVSVRARGNRDLGVMPLSDFASKLAEDIAAKA